MKEVGSCLEANACTREVANKKLLALGSAMARSMADTAKKSYSDFAAKQFTYE